MQFSTIFASALMGAASAVATGSTVHVVSVGSTGDSPLTFSPNNMTVPEGDMIQFQFRAGNHTVTQSNFDNPCIPMSLSTNMTGIYSGFMPVAAGEDTGEVPTYTVTVDSSTPMWFYCSQASHCQNGMVMVVNENTAANSTRSLDSFMELAAFAPANLPGDATSIDQDGTGYNPSNGTDGTTPTYGDDATETTSTPEATSTLVVAAAAGFRVPAMLSAVAAFAALML